MALCGANGNVLKKVYEDSRDEGMVTTPSKLEKGLPRQTESLCPECVKIIPATIYADKGALMMKKDCDEHGHFEDVLWSDVELYLKAEKWAFDGVGIENPQVTNATTCPTDCGLCNLHYTNTCLANIDLTNRCNLKCPVCFANANAAGYVFEPSYEQIAGELKMLREQRPIPVNAIQLSGGEPTIYPKFHEVLREANRLGFTQIQVATNGIRMANEPKFLDDAAKAGLHTIYLQFDGLRDENYKKTRGVALLETKKKVIANVRALPREKRPSVVLVPTIVKTFNDDQVGEIIKYAIENGDVIKGINFQPVSLSGRIPDEDRRKLRYTLSDLVHDVEKQTGYLTADDWYPPPFVSPLSELFSIFAGTPKTSFTTHPGCGLASYFFLQKGKLPLPITRFVDVEGLMEDLWALTQEARGKRMLLLTKVKAFRILSRHFDQTKSPDQMSLVKMRKILGSMLTRGDKQGISEFSWATMYVGAMHFMDLYNYDIERVKRCGVHYATPDGRIIPFCAYNTGPVFRESTEKKFSVPLEEWRKKHEA